MNISPARLPLFSKSAGTFVGARPSSTTPPQSPAAPRPTGEADVETRGKARVPRASSLPERVTMRAPGSSPLSRYPGRPLMTVPGAITSRVGSGLALPTKTGAGNVYTGQSQTVLTVTSVETTTPSTQGSP